MKKIGILYGRENTFPEAFVERVNQKMGTQVAEPVRIDKLLQGRETSYSVIIDRISQDVPFYRAYLKNAALTGTAVINNPFWWSADEKFFNNCLARSLGIPVPETALLPSKAHPDNTSGTSFRNLSMPFDWEMIMGEVGFPAYMKPHDGGGWRNVYRIDGPEDLWDKHKETGQLVMLLQEEIQFDDYFRCYAIGCREVRIMPYNPANPHESRYDAEMKTTGPAGEKLLQTMEEYVLRLNVALGYDFNTVEFAVRDGIPYAIDFCNPAPDADVHSVGQENFEWVVEAAADLAIRRAEKYKPGMMNLTWGTFVSHAVIGELVS